MDKVAKLKLIVVDVDGTMTDAGIYYDEFGNELKKFSTKDAAGIALLKEAGIEVMVLTGRKCKATERRMQELKVNYIMQGIKNKENYLKQFMEEKRMSKENIGYIGDDLNDLKPMSLAGFVCCPNDACDEIKKVSDYVSVKNGGNGVVRDVAEYILRQRGQWDELVIKCYGAGI